jgi:hypothetical protein
VAKQTDCTTGLELLRQDYRASLRAILSDPDLSSDERLRRMAELTRVYKRRHEQELESVKAQWRLDAEVEDSIEPASGNSISRLLGE